MGVRGFRPSGRVPFAAMQKEPKNRWGTARGASGCALRPNGLTPDPRRRKVRFTWNILTDIPRFAPLRLLFPANPLRWASPGDLRPCVGRTLQKLMRRTLPVWLGNLVRFTGDTLYPTTKPCKTCFRCVLPPWPAGAARCGVPLNQEVLNGAGQTGQVPGCTICKLRRRRTMAETFRFLTT